MQVQVFGLGSAGWAATQLLVAQGHQVTVFDEKISPQLADRRAQLEPLGVSVQLQTPLALLPTTAEIIVSPGIRWDHPTLQEARARGITVLGEAELAWRVLHEIPWVGITGTNGKTTTTALIAAMFTAAGKNAPACGNIGLPLSQVALEVYQTGHSPDWIIAELSSYQLEASATLASALTPNSSRHIGVWTTFTPDHLERHGTLESYAAIKSRLLNRATYQVINGDDPYLYTHHHLWPQALWTSLQDPTAPVQLKDHHIWIKDHSVAALADFPLRMPGQHNLQNVMMATAAAHLAGLNPQAIARAIAQFAGVPHRLETVIEVQGIRCINDSKATNYDAAQVALQSVQAPIILIAGGQPKQGDDQGWIELIQANVAAVLLIGAAAEQFAARLQQVNYTSYQIAHTLDVAVPLAWDQARSLQQAGHHPAVTVLFSPACASFDQYSNFEHRGDHFRTCCQLLGY